MFASIHDGSMMTAFVQSWVSARDAGRFAYDLMYLNGPYIDSGRVAVARKFLSAPKYADADILLTVDTDIRFTIDHVDRVVAQCSEEDPIVSGVYIGPTPNGLTPLAYRLGVDDPFFPHPRETRLFVEIPFPELAAGSGLVQAQAAGLGFCCFHRSFVEEAFMRSNAPWAEFWLDDAAGEGRHCGEDMSFGMRLWQWGHAITLDTDVHVGHIKRQMIGM